LDESLFNDLKNKRFGSKFELHFSLIVFDSYAYYIETLYFIRNNDIFLMKTNINIYLYKWMSNKDLAAATTNIFLLNRSEREREKRQR
jgi:hypothetical protein